MWDMNDLLTLSGKTAIVTGGAMGIGKGIVARLHEAGAAIVIADYDAEATQATSAAFNALRPDSVIGVVADVSKAADVKKMVAAAVDTFGSLDILVNNAGVFPAQPISDMTEADFERVININLKGIFLGTKFASEQMIQQGNGGKIINVTSIDALHPSMVGLAHYDASKHGAWGFTKNAALELAEHKIWVNAIAPGGIATPGVAKMQGQSAQAAIQEAFLARIPMHRMGEPDDIGKVALFLASDMASYITGEQIVVDGGALLA